MSPDDLSAAWFSEVFDADITGLHHEPIGDGLVGMNLRVVFDEASTTVPRSVVVKLPSADPTSRATGIALRNYEREVKFYQRLADTVDIRVPACHHAEWREDSGEFVLVLEDMAPAEQGDQLAGCSPETAAVTVAELVRLHGPRWGDAELNDVEWLSRRGPEDAEQLVGLWRMMLPGFLATYRVHLSDDQATMLEAFGGRLANWVEARGGPLTVTHGDFRLDNLLFGAPDGAAPPVTAVDWQTPGHGVPSGDLSYFIGAGLVPADRRAHEAELVAVYADGLAAYGVSVDRGALFDDYRRDSFAGVIMAVVASQVVGASERSEAMFAAMATRHLQQAIDLDALELVPEP